MIQKLQGVKITPRGSRNRFSRQNWPNSYAFGGWIYNVSTSIGYGNSPTEIRMSIVLETSTFSQTAATFDITENDLHCDAGIGTRNQEIWFDIDLEGVTFSNFILYEYDFSIEVNQKILNVVFKDYSIILDKIYVGLFKKQGYVEQYKKTSFSEVEFPVVCQDCQYSGSLISGTGIVFRDINFASYAGFNEKIYDNLRDFYYGQKIHDAWKNLTTEVNSNFANEEYRSIHGQNNQFNLNGGYLILGNESVTEEKCNSSPDVSYSFIELLTSLRACGLNFIGEFPKEIYSGSHYLYKANYIGTLREVMQNWCSDLGYDFYCSGRSFIGLNIKETINISDVSKISDPTSNLGKYFQINSSNGGNSAILSFKSSSSLNNTFKQSVIVENSYPITQTNTQKSVKRYVGFTPLHPISLNEWSTQLTNDKNIYGSPFVRNQFETDRFDSDRLRFSTMVPFYKLDGRSYADVDAAIALSNYSDVLRDIFVAQRALENYIPQSLKLKKMVDNFGGDSTEVTALENPYCLANFNALGMFPILEITDKEMKGAILDEYFSMAEKDDFSNLNTEAKYFRIFLGYYFDDIKQDIVSWEKNAANTMYKYGMVTKGTLSQFPFVSPDLLNDISPTEGFYGQKGLSYTRIKNSFTPSADRYLGPTTSPFKDVLLYDGLVKSFYTGYYPFDNPELPPLIPPGFSLNSILTGGWIAELDNDWGTTKQDFLSELSLNFEDPCAAQYSLEDNVQEILTESTRNLQDWKLDYFKPIVSDKISKIDDVILANKNLLNSAEDQITTVYTDTHWGQKKTCKKLHVMIIPDTLIHPNLNVFFKQKGVNKVNLEVLNRYKKKLYEAEKSKSETQTPSICSLNLLEEICESILSGGQSINLRNSLGSTPTNIETGCVILEDKSNFIEGFPREVLYSRNSRSLSITISKNPEDPIYGSQYATDEYGYNYYSDIIDEVSMDSRTSTLEIVYPIQSFPDSIANYSGILSSDVSTEIRLPALTQIYGKPINLKNNNTSSIKIINSNTDSSLNPQLSPLNNQVVSFITVITGNGNVLQTPEQYYNFISSLNDYNLDTPTKNVEITLAGPPKEFGKFIECLTPSSGLNKMSISVSDNGVKTSLSFSDRPKTLPKQEAILNKIGPRIKGTYN